MHAGHSCARWVGGLTGALTDGTHAPAQLQGVAWQGPLWGAGVPAQRWEMPAQRQDSIWTTSRQLESAHQAKWDGPRGRGRAQWEAGTWEAGTRAAGTRA